MYQPPTSLLHNNHFVTSPTAGTAKSSVSLMFDAFTTAFGACPANASSSPFSIPSMLPQNSSSFNPSHSLCSPPSSSSGTLSSSLSVVHSSFGTSGKRERTKYSEQQLNYLESEFKINAYPDVQMREHIAKNLQLTDVKVQVWFKNRRAKQRNEKKMEQIRTGGTQCHGPNEAGPSNSSAAIGGVGKGEKRRNGDERTTVTKREESVEDTEEENQQPPRKKAMSNGGTNVAFLCSASAEQLSERQKDDGQAVPTAASSSSSVQLPYDLQKGLLIPQIDPFLYGSNLPSSSSSPYPTSSSSSVEMGSLMAVASTFSPQVPSLYGGWSAPSACPSTAFLSSSYVSPGHVPQQLTPFVYPPAYYQQNNYYFNNPQQQQQSVVQTIELDPKNERE